MLTPADLLTAVREHGAIGALRRARNWAGSTAISALEGSKTGVSVVDEDWDILIVLDACRYDVFESVNTIPGTLERRTSQGSVTWSFLRQNFEGRQLHDTVYLSANAVVGNTAEALDVHRLVGLWGGADSPGDDEIATPQDVVENALELHEAYPNKRLVVHFLPPHTPFLVKDGETLPSDSPYRDYRSAMAGEISAEEMRAVYEENLEYVLGYVEELINGIHGKTVVTADHGELIGEGIPTLYEILHPRWPVSKRRHFDYAHYSHVRTPELVEVPWLVVDGGGERRRIEAEDPTGTDMDTSSLDEQLEALGYKP